MWKLVAEYNFNEDDETDLMTALIELVGPYVTTRRVNSVQESCADIRLYVAAFTRKRVCKIIG